MSLNESIVEDAALEWFPLRRLLRKGYEGQEGFGGQIGELVPRSREVGHGAPFAKLRRAKPSPAPGEPAAERDSFSEVVQFRFARTLTPALSQKEREKCEAIRRLNPAISSRSLATLRDTLLPKLLSGESRVEDASKNL
ncbi:MAG: hypothetical protein H7A55_02950 [Verrucomicrobiaceae bacterium]|nr:hypothetical protein [Verrucomicrobiaceae bacterium]